MHSRKNAPARDLLLFGLGTLAIVLLAPVTSTAQIEGASYTLQPSYNVIRWNKDTGIDNTELFGGRLGLNLGQYVSLQGYYLGRNDVRTHLASVENLPPPGGAALTNQKLNLALYGGDLVFNFNPDENIVPFIKLGGGILRVDPRIGDVSQNIALKGGAGIRFGIARLQAELFAEDLAFRLNRYNLAPFSENVLFLDPDHNTLRHNLSIGAGIDFNLGGYEGRQLTETDRAIADRFRSGFSGLTLPIEPFAGRLTFSDQMALGGQDLFGLRTGVDFGRYFGVRGYYWRGVNTNFTKTQNIQSWGAESQFNLNSGAGAVPFLIAGVGQLEFRNGFLDETGAKRDNETMLILGGGVGLNLAQRLRLDVAARDYVIANPAVQNVSTVNDISSNWLFTAGLSISLFGNPPAAAPFLSGRERDRERGEPAAPKRAPKIIVKERELEEGGEEMEDEFGDSLPGDGEGRLERWYGMRGRHGEGMMPPANLDRRELRERLRVRRESMLNRVPPVRNFQGDRVVTLPVPEEGELYIRYGRPGGVRIESRGDGHMGGMSHMEGMNRMDGMSGMSGMSEMHQAMPMPPMTPMTPMTPPPGGPSTTTPAMPMNPAAPAPPASPAAPPSPPMTAMPGMSNEALADEQRFNDRMDRLERLLSDRMDRIEERLDNRTSAPAAPPAAETAPGETNVPQTREGVGWNPEAVKVYTGLNVDKPTQMVFGARLNLGPVTRRSAFDFLPEVALGFGQGGNSLLFAGNIYYDFGRITENRRWNPFVGAGLGLLRFADDPDNAGHSGTEAVLNIAYGVNATVGRYTAFAEHQGVDLFDLNRILVGVRLNIR